MTRLICSLLLSLLVAGCGYALSDDTLKLPDGVARIYIKMFENRTLEPYLENVLTTHVTRRLQLLPDIELVEDAATADAVLSGRVIGYTVDSLAYDSQNLVVQYRATLRMEADLRRQSDGRILWRGEMIRYQSFSSDPDLQIQYDLERIAQELLAIRLAEELSLKLTQTF